MPQEVGHDNSTNDAYARGVELYRSGRYNEAIRELSQLQRIGGAVGHMARFYEGMAHRALGVAAMAEGRLKVAEGRLRSAIQVIGPSADLPRYLASVYARSAKAGPCCAAMEQAAKACPADPQLLRQLAQAQWQAGVREKATQTVASALRLFGSDSGLHVQMGLFHAAEDKPTEARACFQEAVDCDCDNGDAHYYLALVFAAEKRFDAAVRELQRTFDLQPDNLLAGYQLALAGQAAQACGYRVALHLPEARRAESQSEMHRLAHYIAEEPQFLEAMLALPASAIDTTLFGLLAAVVKTALAEFPRYADLRFYCSRILDRLGQTDEAIEQGYKALAINPAYVQALLHTGGLYERAGRTDEAIGLFRWAVRNGGDWADLHHRLARLLMQTGATDDARTHLQRSLQLNSEYPPAQETLRRLAA